MKPSLDRRQLLQAGLGLGSLLWLPRARACEFVTSTLRVTHPWARATAHDEDFAVLGMKFDEVVEDDRLVLVQTPVAGRADIGGKGARPVVDLPILAGREVFLDEAGTYVRLLGLTGPLLQGRTYPLVLGFEKSGVHHATLSVDYERFR